MGRLNLACAVVLAPFCWGCAHQVAVDSTASTASTVSPAAGSSTGSSAGAGTDVAKAAPQAAGQEEAVASAEDEWVYPCKGDEAQRVLDELERLKEQVDDQAIAWPELRVALRELSNSTCFDIGGRLAAEHDQYQPGSWEAAARYFDMAHSHMLGFASLGQANSEFLWGRPTYPQTLTREAAPQHKLAPLLCSAVDTACLSETAAWRARAELRFSTGWRRTENEADRAEWSCREAAGESVDKFSAEIHCIFLHIPKGVAFPVGGLRSPSFGWLRIGRRSSWRPDCHQTLLVRLTDGRALQKEQCTKRVRTTGTNQYESQPPSYVRGQVDEGLSREALWFALFAPELALEPNTGVLFPAGARARLKSHVETRRGWGTMRRCPDTTALSWAYAQGKDLHGQGSFTSYECGGNWSYRVGAEITNDYPRELFEVALASFAPHANVSHSAARLEFEKVSRSLPKVGE